MMNRLKKHGRIVAIFVLITLLMTLIPAAFSGIIFKEASARELTEDEKKMAADISNTTGAKIEEILAMKKQGKTWNEILEALKGKGQNSDDRKQRDKLLVNEGLGEDTIDQLKKEGFKLEEIMEAKLLVERVLFQLQEITGGNTVMPAAPKVELQIPGTGTGKQEEDMSAYAELAGKIDSRMAVSLMLKLKKEFGSFEKVLDEYLLSLQIGINLEDYLKDREAYRKQKEEKGLSLDSKRVITLAGIEEKMLRKIQEGNTKSKPDALSEVKAGAMAAKPQIENEAPKPPVPETKDVRPKNPTDDIMKEIKQINPMGQ